jgi:hypothetical protein
VAVNVAEVEPAGTVTKVVVVRRGLLLDTVTVMLPAGAALESVTPQDVPAPDPKLVGLQVSIETSTGATSPTVAFAELALYVAVTVAL